MGLRRRTTKVILAVTILSAVLFTGVVVLLVINLKHPKPSSPSDPFDAKTLAAVSFPLYYPTWLPQGYKIDQKSINLPQTGIVVYTITSSASSKIYISQEARPNKFNFGGYYNNFSSLTEHVTKQGTIATGYVNAGRAVIGSLVTGKTWVLVNTSVGTVTPADLAHILQSLAVSH